MAERKTIAGAVHEFVRHGFVYKPGKPKMEVREDPTWKAVRSTGSELWLDTGDLEEASKLWTAEFKALTTNNTLLNKEVQKGIYDGLIQRAAAALQEADPHLEEKDLLLEVSFILNAYHGLRLVEQFDAHVSVELHTDLAGDVNRTVEYGQRLYRICPERFYIKVPLTPAGFLGARKLGDLGVPVNFTLGFSARQNYLAALLSRPRFVNVFLGRLNSFVANSNLGDGKNIGEKATLAAQREILALRGKRRTETLLIGASMREGAQVSSLAGVDVLTMPTNVAGEYRESPDQGISSQVEEDPPVEFAPGAGLDGFNGSTLWDVPGKFKSAVEDLLKMDPAALKPEGLQVHFEREGFPDFLPRWSPADWQAVSSDGKIPVYERWARRLRSKEMGMDALMNISGLRSFATDQAVLDNRIRSLV